MSPSPHVDGVRAVDHRHLDHVLTGGRLDPQPVVAHGLVVRRPGR
jgi:hypothetical protein